MEKKEIVCVQCPLGCVMEVTYDFETKEIEVKGNRCPRGYEYAKEEIFDPKRILTTVVKVQGGDIPLVSVKTSKPISFKKIWNVMKLVKKIQVSAPVKCGEVILRDIDGSGADLIATKTVKDQG